MTNPRTSLAILLAGLLAVAGAQAQSAMPGGNSDGPPAAGEASNQTNGQPNAKTTNSPYSEAPIPTRAEVRAQARGENNVYVVPVSPATGAMGYGVYVDRGAGYSPSAGKPANTAVNNPSVFQGGTPE